MNVIKYNRNLAVDYAKKWALARNEKYFNFDSLGGDCTNFVSQCVFSGARVMNYTPILGWYYNSPSDRTPSWTGVNEFRNFILFNKNIGPFGKLVNISNIEVGDIIQLGDKFGKFYHAVIVTEKNYSDIMVCSHTRNALNIPLESFKPNKILCVHIEGVRK